MFVNGPGSAPVFPAQFSKPASPVISQEVCDDEVCDSPDILYTVRLIFHQTQRGESICGPVEDRLVTEEVLGIVLVL